MPILHEHFAPGSLIKEIEAHTDMVTAIDFDFPFGTMITAALDDTVRVWDMNVGRCSGFLEGHHASVRCLQVEDNIVATGSMDASVRLWDLSRARPSTRDGRLNKHERDDEEAEPEHTSPVPPSSNLEDCHVFSLEAHVDEVTALHFRGDTLISGSADKTLRQWDLVKGRCVQTLDVLWASAQASSMTTTDSGWRPSGRLPDASADFVGAVQCFDAALACGTADGMVRLWDLRSGQVHRSLVGHTGPVTCLQFDDAHLVTGSLDRSIRVRPCLLVVYKSFLTLSLDLGPAYGLYLRRVRLRQAGHQHDVRCEAHRRRYGRERGQGVRQGRRPPLGLRAGRGRRRRRPIPRDH